MAEKRSPARLTIVVICLVAAGALLFSAIGELVEELERGPGASGEASPALIEAVAAGDAEALKSELTRGADPNGAMSTSGRFPQGYTPLMIACEAGHLGCARALLDAEARLDARAADGKTALMVAAGWGGHDVVQLLVEEGARLDARTEDSWTALQLAAARGTVESVRALVGAGADVDAKNKWNQTALMAAARSGDAEKVEVILGGGAVADLADSYGATALGLACGSGAPPEVLTALLAAGADLNRGDNDGVTPLMKAAERGDAALVRVLLAAGADVTLRDSNGWTAREWAQLRPGETGAEVMQLLEED